jgi:uncharacterized protein YtpQ (UPF0354 family)
MTEVKRVSLQRRIVELVQRQLPAGWTCEPEGEDLVLICSRDGQTDRNLVSLEALYKLVEKQPERRRETLHSITAQVIAFVRGKTADRRLVNQEQRVYPVIRHVSLAQRQGQNWVVKPHTEETVIAYALDNRDGYLMIEQDMLSDADWTEEQLHQYALENLRNLPFSMKTEQVGKNLIHFISPRDGYAASRILLTDLLMQVDREKTGNVLGVAIPHQDVLILADLHDDRGAQMLAVLTYEFASKGTIPIYPLPFFYERGELTPYIVVEHGKRIRTQRKQKR